MDRPSLRSRRATTRPARGPCPPTAPPSSATRGRSAAAFRNDSARSLRSLIICDHRGVLEVRADARVNRSNCEHLERPQGGAAPNPRGDGEVFGELHLAPPLLLKQRWRWPIFPRASARISIRLTPRAFWPGACTRDWF